MEDTLLIQKIDALLEKRLVVFGQQFEQLLDKRFDVFGRQVEQLIENRLDSRFKVFEKGQEGRFVGIDKRFEAFDKRFDKLDDQVDFIAQTVSGHEERFNKLDATNNRILVKLFKHDGQLEKLEENMATKASVSKVDWGVGELRIAVQKVDDELRVQNKWWGKHDVKDHRSLDEGLGGV